MAIFDPADRAQYAQIAPEDILVCLSDHLAHALTDCGYLDQAVAYNAVALAEARRLSHAPTLAQALGYAFIVRCWGGCAEVLELLQYADELLALSEEHGYAFWRAFAHVERGWCLAASGRAKEEGLRLLATGLNEIRVTGTTIALPGEFERLIDAERIGGDHKLALQHLEEAELLSKSKQIEYLHAEFLRHRGDLLASTGDPAGAEAGYCDAISLAQRQGGKLFELRAAIGLARLCRNQGKCREAYRLLAPVYGGFTEGFGARDLQAAKALMLELGAAPD